MQSVSEKQLREDKKRRGKFYFAVGVVALTAGFALIGSPGIVVGGVLAVFGGMLYLTNRN